jgi:hypothetical protein
VRLGTQYLAHKIFGNHHHQVNAVRALSEQFSDLTQIRIWSERSGHSSWCVRFASELKGA